MKVFPLSACMAVLAVACKLQPDSSKNYDEFNENKVYKLGLNPAEGSSYYYDITNESETKVEVEDKKVDNLSETNVGVTYTIKKDSTGNFLFEMVYDKVHLHTETGEVETDLDAANAAVSINPVEKMLGILKEAKITANISPSGEVKSINGYKEMGDKMMARFAENDVSGRSIAQSQWDKLIGQSIVKKNMDQLFKIFPDSAVHLGDTWKLDSKQEGEITLHVKSVYTLKAINNDIAIIEANGKITSDNTATGFMGLGTGVSIDVKGAQQGEFEMETKTGMLISCKIKTNVEGTSQVMGRDIPVVIKTNLKLNGRKLK